MSTKMHCHRLPKDQWWTFASMCRTYYLRNYPMMNVLNEIINRKEAAVAYRQISDVVDVLTNRDTGYTVDLQLFDEGETYLIRPLEQGWFFSNNVKEWIGHLDLTEVNYDNRSDVPPEEEGNEAVAEWMDAKINGKAYFIYNVLHRDDFMDVAINALINRDKEREQQ